MAENKAEFGNATIRNSGRNGRNAGGDPLLVSDAIYLKGSLDVMIRQVLSRTIPPGDPVSL